MASSRALTKDTRGMACTIEHSELGIGSDDPVRITDYQFLASYNWSRTEEPTIFIPGCPALWTPPSLPLQLSKDNRKVPADRKISRPPVHSFDPFFKSLLAMHPDFNMNPVSVVSNRNNLRKLFDFACNKVGRSFRIDVDMIYDTMFFTRWEPSHMQLVNGYGDSGFGHEFERAFTTLDEDLVDSAGHHRIAQYNLGGLNCLVRFEADAYFVASPGSNSLSLDRNSSAATATITGNEISIPFQSLSLKSPETDPESTAKNGVRIIKSGRLVPPTSVIEVKSRSRNIRMADIIPQLWLSQTEHLFVGYHHQGLIEQEPKHYEMAPYFGAWEIQHEEHLKILLSLILRIREAVQGMDGRKGAIVYNHAEKSRKLRIYKTDKNNLMALLDEEKKCWKREGV